MTSPLALARRWVPRLLAVGLLIYAIQRAGPDKIWQVLQTADLPSVGLSALMVVPFVMVRATRWQALLRELHIVIGPVEANRLYAIGLLIGTITPGQAGDAIKAWYLSQRRHSLAVALLSCVLDRLFDLLVLTAIATTALAVYWPNETGQWLLGSAIIGGVLAGLLFLARPTFRRWLTSLPGIAWLWGPIERRLRRVPWGNALLDSELGRPALVLALPLTCLSFVVTLTRVYLIFRAVGVDLPLLSFLAVASITVFASLVSVAGIGSRDVALIALLAPFGYGSDQAVAISFLFLFLNLTNLVPGLIAWLGRPAQLHDLPAMASLQSATSDRHEQ